MALQAVLSDPTATGLWTLVPDRSAIRFTSRTLWGLIPVNGRFTDVHGDARLDPGGALTGRVVIGAASVKTGIGMRDKHLSTADFFDADRYPEIIVEVNGDGGSELLATLSIRGTTLPVSLQATAERLPDGGIRVSAQTVVDRTRWGVSGNMAGMMPPQTVLAADAVFVKAAI